MFPSETWAEIDSSGWSLNGLAALRRELEAGHGSTAMAVVVAGTPVFEWGRVAEKSSVASVRKSLVNVLFGIEVARGTIRLSDTLDHWGIDDVESLSAAERQATVADLLMARSGVYHPSVYDTPHHRPTRGNHEPGAHWFYNNWDFNVLGTILLRATGNSVGGAFAKNIAGPLQLQDFEPTDACDQHGPESRHPVYKLRLSARDLARIGLLYLRAGRWNGQPVVSGDWVHQSTQPHTDLGGGRGYGLLWWSAQVGATGDALGGRHALFYASGLGGQYIIVVPALDLVVVHRAARVYHGIHHGQMGTLLRLLFAAQSLVKPPSPPAAPAASSLSPRPPVACRHWAIRG